MIGCIRYKTLLCPLNPARYTSKNGVAQISANGTGPIEPSRGKVSPATAPTGNKAKGSPGARLFYWLKRVPLPFKSHRPPNGVAPAEAVTSFLGTMMAEAQRAAPAWTQILDGVLEDCGISYDARHEFFQEEPVEELYFAAAVAMEAVRIRRLYQPSEANAALAEIAEQVDKAALCSDRALSEMVFDLISRINLTQSSTPQKQPHDIATKAILEHLGFRDNERLRELMLDKGFRHSLAESLAVGFRDWWGGFAARFVLNVPPEEENKDSDDDVPVTKTAKSVRRPCRPRRATTF